MSEITEYLTLTATTVAELDQLVAVAIRNGYSPYMAPYSSSERFVNYQRGSPITDAYAPRYHQAMTKLQTR